MNVQTQFFSLHKDLCIKMMYPTITDYTSTFLFTALFGKT